jgi:hypothetical protein
VEHITDAPLKERHLEISINLILGHNRIEKLVFGLSNLAFL